MSLELANGFPVLLVDYGTGTVQLSTDTIGVSDGEFHRIDIIWSKAVSSSLISVHVSVSLLLGEKVFDLRANGTSYYLTKPYLS